MKKEIDTYKLRQLFDVFKNAILWAWYLSGVGIFICLWFFNLPPTNIQAFAFGAVFIFYSLLSVCISKLSAIRSELEG